MQKRAINFLNFWEGHTFIGIYDHKLKPALWVELNPCNGIILVIKELIKSLIIKLGQS